MKYPSHTPKRILSLLDNISHELHVEAPFKAGMNRGEKRMFIRQHRDTIIDCCDLFGDDFTMRNFSLERDTLDRVKNRPETLVYKKVTHAEAALLKADTALKVLDKLEHRVASLEIRIGELAETRREVRELKELYSQFSKITAQNISKALLIPLLDSLVKQYSPDMPESVDPVALSMEAKD